MDATQLSELALHLVEGIAPLVAGGTLAKIGETTTDTAVNALSRAWDMLQRQFAGNRKAEAALDIFEEEANKPDSQARVAQQIVAVFQSDPAAIAELGVLVDELRRLRPQLPAPQRTHNQNISGNAHVETAVTGDVHGGVNTTTHQSGGINFGSGNTSNQSGDIVAGDKIDASGSQGFVNRPTGPVHQVFGNERNINTGGGDYAEGGIDKSEGSFVGGDQFNMPGDFREAALNIKLTLQNVTQTIGTMSTGDFSTKQQLEQLIGQLATELEKAPADKIQEAEQVAKRAETAVTEAAKPSPDKEDVQYSLDRLQKAAQNIGSVLPTVLPIAAQIAVFIGKLIGS